MRNPFCSATVCLISAFVIITFPSCKENPLEQYGDTVIEKYQHTEQLSDEVSLSNIQNSIKAFHALHERYPFDLAELGEFVGTPLSAERYNYEPSSGTIRYRQ